MKLLLCIFILTAASGFSTDNQYSDSGIIHTFKSGKMLIQSQVDRTGQMTVSLKSLTPDTWFNFQDISSKNHSKKNKKYTLKGTMHVKDDSGICAGWVDIQPLTIAIDPKLVDRITLTGRPVYQSGSIAVLFSEHEERSSQEIMNQIQNQL